MAGIPARFSRVVSGCSSAVSSSAATHGSTTIRSALAIRAITYSSNPSSSSRHDHPAAVCSHLGTCPRGVLSGRAATAAGLPSGASCCGADVVMPRSAPRSPRRIRQAMSPPNQLP